MRNVVPMRSWLPSLSQRFPIYRAGQPTLSLRCKRISARLSAPGKNEYQKDLTSNPCALRFSSRDKGGSKFKLKRNAQEIDLSRCGVKKLSRCA